MKNFVFALSLLLLSSVASANLVFSPNIGYYSTSTDESTPSTVNREETFTYLDMKVGYVMPMGLYFGGMYSSTSSESCAGGTCSDGSGFNIGPTIGYMSAQGIYAHLTYYIMGEEGDNPKNSGGKGPQIDLGWMFPLSSSFFLGPQLTYRSIEYDTREENSISADTDEKDTVIAPYISLWFMF